MLVLLVRVFWKKLQGLWEKAKQGGAILALTRVRRPRRAALLRGWAAKLGVIAVFLAAYGIPVTFHTVMSVTGGNSLANTVSATPGGVGINQAINTASLSDVTDPATAAAYSTGQQLIVTAFNIVFVVLVVWAFGWTGGKCSSRAPTTRRVKVAEQKAQRQERKAAARSGGERQRRDRASRRSSASASRRTVTERDGRPTSVSPAAADPPAPAPDRVDPVRGRAAIRRVARAGSRSRAGTSAFVAAALIAILNALLPPLLAACACR